MQFGASTEATQQWFKAQNMSYYLLGFAFNGNVTFTGPLLHRLQPRARMYVVSVDQFFRQVKPLPAALVMTDTVRARYRLKRGWQFIHRAACGRASALCGKEFAYVRTRSDGSWILAGGHNWKSTPVGYADAVDTALLNDYMRVGQSFISQLPVEHDCILLTLIPSAAGSSVTKTGTAKALAKALGLTFIAPEPTNLTTFDGSHLDKRSAEEWSSAFIREAAPVIQRCLTSP
jgi:hypothetical protein